MPSITITVSKFGHNVFATFDGLEARETNLHSALDKLADKIKERHRALKCLTGRDMSETGAAACALLDSVLG